MSLTNDLLPTQLRTKNQAAPSNLFAFGKTPYTERHTPLVQFDQKWQEGI